MTQTFLRSFGHSVVVSGCLCLVVGCHKAPPPAQPAPVVVHALAPKPNAILPVRQPGLWETTITETGSEDAPQVLQICMDALTDQHLGILGRDLSGDACSKKTISKMPDGSWGILADCNMGTGGDEQFSGSISGDYVHAYTMKMRSQITGASLPQMNHITTYAVTSKWTGDCAKGQKPGDVITAGTTVNLFDMAGIKTASDTSESAQNGGPAPVGD